MDRMPMAPCGEAGSFSQPFEGFDKELEIPYFAIVLVAADNADARSAQLHGRWLDVVRIWWPI